MADLINVNGTFPQLGLVCDSKPQRSEGGIGALMPWADKLWMITYVAHLARSGGGTGLFTLDQNLQLEKRPESVVGTFANRMIHKQSEQLVIGPHLVDTTGNVRTVETLCEHRLTATMQHLVEPSRMVYFLTMEGLIFEVDVETLEARRLWDLNDELQLDGAPPHFKGGHVSQGRLVVANNTYAEEDFAGERAAGRLAEYVDGQWQIIESTCFNEVTGRTNWDEVIFATGFDRASAILRVCVNGQWSRYLLPKASHCFDHYWQTEWPRIREVESERYLMDCHGMFYEFSPVLYGGRLWGIRPVSTHLRIIPDYCSWRGMLVLGGNQATPMNDTNMAVGQPQAGLWFGKTDDLWQFGKPKGWGGPWWKAQVPAGVPSDPYLMTGFEHKVLHLANESNRAVEVTVEVDFLGDGSWHVYDHMHLPTEAYRHHVFPSGFSAHWVRLISDTDARLTGYFVYG